MIKTPNAKMLLVSLTRKGLLSKPPVDIDQIAQALGLQVIEDSSLEARAIISGIVIEKGIPTVKINPERCTSEARRRFTIAHSIGHYCLHDVRSGKEFWDSYSPHVTSDTQAFWDACEFEANNFASQLLIPNELILKESDRIIRIDGDSSFIDVMARRFNVPNNVMSHRLKRMGLVKNEDFESELIELKTHRP